ncbi:haloacid dehalogenase type II [Vibrio sp. 1CM24A]|uniref:haloacid dehalogenase type II n=1 Tax=Vibrio sp. 1CM24A TaxID=2929165 RepID=UPI0020BDB0A1|nr:haloacid dehalogenase type II [Vibrio sp. 1CM24A]MCK8083672.1 haloacid dehalogenase type II [Vibrio sp. 1CM24A]
MKTTLAFDVYGTLIDTQGVLQTLEKWLDTGDALSVSKLWREKQLEYSFRRGLMRDYVDFSVCTKDALEYALLVQKVELNDEQKVQLMNVYKTLPAFDDVVLALEALKEKDVALYAFSNGSLEAVSGLLKHAGIYHYFDGVVSCADVQSFKPDPEVYEHFLREADTTMDRAWLISSNPFDVTGSISAGFRSAWVKRHSTVVFDPWNIQPSEIVSSLTDVVQVIG